MMSQPDEEDAKNILINPFYAVSFADYLFKPHGTGLAKEDWVLANTKLIKEEGSTDWLKQLLVNLTTEPTENLKHMVMNPQQVVIFSERLYGVHEPIVDADTWLEANKKLMDKLGFEEWLYQLLNVLETGGPEPA